MKSNFVRIKNPPRAQIFCYLHYEIHCEISLRNTIFCFALYLASSGGNSFQKKNPKIFIIFSMFLKFSSFILYQILLHRQSKAMVTLTDFCPFVIYNLICAYQKSRPPSPTKGIICGFYYYSFMILVYILWYYFMASVLGLLAFKFFIPSLYTPVL